jgi:hypothetical protein
VVLGKVREPDAITDQRSLQSRLKPRPEFSHAMLAKREGAA